MINGIVVVLLIGSTAAMAQQPAAISQVSIVSAIHAHCGFNGSDGLGGYVVNNSTSRLILVTVSDRRRSSTTTYTLEPSAREFVACGTQDAAGPAFEVTGARYAN